MSRTPIDFNALQAWQFEDFFDEPGEETALIEIKVAGVEMIRWTAGLLHTGEGPINVERDVS